MNSCNLPKHGDGLEILASKAQFLAPSSCILDVHHVKTNTDRNSAMTPSRAVRALPVGSLHHTLLGPCERTQRRRLHPILSVRSNLPKFHSVRVRIL